MIFIGQFFLKKKSQKNAGQIHSIIENQQIDLYMYGNFNPRYIHGD